MGFAFRSILGAYYLALGTWFGATVMMGLGAGLTFITLRQYHPMLTTGPTSHPELAPRTADYLAGNVVWRTFEGLAVVQIVCAVVVGIAVIVQCTWCKRLLRHGVLSWSNSLRVMLVTAAILLMAVGLTVLRPNMARLRPMMYDVNLSEAQRVTVRHSFDVYHVASTRVLSGAALLVAATALISPFVFKLGAGAEDGPARSTLISDPATPDDG